MTGKLSTYRSAWLQIACILLGVLGLTGYAASNFPPGRWIVFVTAIGVLGFIIGLAVRARRLGARLRSITVSLLAAIAGT